MAQKRPQDRKPKANRRPSKPSTWDELVDEVTIEPYPLPAPDGTVYEIHQPTGEEARKIREGLSDGEVDDEDVFRLLAGDEIADVFAPHFATAPATVVTSIVMKLSSHFNTLPDPTSRT